MTSADTKPTLIDARIYEPGDYPPERGEGVRAPVAPIRIAVGAPDPLGLGVGEHDAPGGGPCSCGAWHREAAAEPAPLPLAAMTGCDSHSVDPRAGCAECNAIAEHEEPSFRTGCAEHLRIWGRGCETCDRLRAGAEPAVREPSAPTALSAHYDDEERRAWIAEALGVPSRLVFLGWSGSLGWALNTITIKRDDAPGVLPEGIRADEIATLAASGIVATANGWTFAKEQGR